jgi:predicted SAM-dependent methyltransferase
MLMRFLARLKANPSDTGQRLFRRVGARLDRTRVRIVRIVAPPPLPRVPGGKVYLNLGSGDITHPYFINVDALVARHVHYLRPIDDLSPFADESVDLVYASHCLEHFSYHRVHAVLTEWRRVLKPGGVLRLGVPDLDRLLEIYEASGRDIESIQGYLMGGQTYPLNYHLAAFTKRSLTDRLKAVGFREVRGWEQGSDELTSLPDCTALTVNVGARTYPISLNLEATR